MLETHSYGALKKVRIAFPKGRFRLARNESIQQANLLLQVSVFLGETRLRKLDDTLQRLAQSFTVRDIMIPFERLVTAGDASEAKRVQATNPSYDVIPIVRNGDVDSYSSRESDKPVPLRMPDLVSESTPILELTNILARREFAFVLSGNRIGGYVHFSDLNNEIVKLPFFAIIEAVEAAVMHDMKDSVNSNVLTQNLGHGRLKTIQKQERKAHYHRADLGLLSHLSLPEILKISVALARISLERVDARKIKEVRNRVSHSNQLLVENHGCVAELAAVRSLCAQIMDQLSSGREKD